MKTTVHLTLAFSLVLGSVLLWAAGGQAHGPGAGLHTDPELLFGWETWLHLSIQWLHLVSFAVWMGLILGTTLLNIRASLDALLFGVWTLVLILLATGVYNMEYSSGLSVSSSFLRYFEWNKVPYGMPYSFILNAKIALYVVVVVFTFWVNVQFLRTKDPIYLERFTKRYQYGSGALVLVASLLAAVLLFYHEAADLWPTPIHSMGGVIGPEGVGAGPLANHSLTPPTDFGLLTSGVVWWDIFLRWVHLVGFGLLLGGAAVALMFGGVRLRRFLPFLWSCLGLQMLSGILSMKRWTPFAVAPYVWNLDALTHVRFGRTYSFLLAVKHGLVLFLVALTVAETIRWFWLPHAHRFEALVPQYFLWMSILFGLGIAFVMMMVLLVHEGVDHAL